MSTDREKQKDDKESNEKVLGEITKKLREAQAKIAELEQKNKTLKKKNREEKAQTRYEAIRDCIKAIGQYKDDPSPVNVLLKELSQIYITSGIEFQDFKPKKRAKTALEIQKEVIDEFPNGAVPMRRLFAGKEEPKAKD